MRKYGLLLVSKGRTEHARTSVSSNHTSRDGREQLRPAGTHVTKGCILKVHV